MTARWLAPVLLLALAGCDVRQRMDAAEGLKGFMAAAESGDRAAFEARIDRPRLRESLKARLRDPATGAPPGLLRRLDTPEGARAVDAMITPEAFRFQFSRLGLVPERSPTAAELAATLRMQGPGRACVPEGPASKRCVMIFAEDGGTWKLVEVSPSRMQIVPTSQSVH